MDILLTAKNTVINKIIREKTNSEWGHSSIIIDDIVYNFDLDTTSKIPFSSFISDPAITKATLFYADMLDKEKDAEELYKYLFDKCTYNTSSLYKLRNKIKYGRDLETIQNEAGSYNCASLISKVYSSYIDNDLIPSSLKDIHWSQYIPNDYSNMEFKKELNR